LFEVIETIGQTLAKNLTKIAWSIWVMKQNYCLC
jgi:hypothetical protein